MTQLKIKNYFKYEQSQNVRFQMGSKTYIPENLYRTWGSKTYIPKNFYVKATYITLLSEKFGSPPPAPSKLHP
ncbi:hypothetical protein Hanom_Chr10g00889081 [Helianthus anomalus]